MDLASAVVAVAHDQAAPVVVLDVGVPLQVLGGLGFESIRTRHFQLQPFGQFAVGGSQLVFEIRNIIVLLLYGA